MKNIITSALLFFALLGTVCGQGRVQGDRKGGVIVPPEVYLPVIVAQTECPLKIEKAYLLKYLDGTYEKVFHIHNGDVRPVKSFKVAIWNSDNTGDVVGWEGDGGKDLLMPGKTIASVGDETLAAVIPLSDQLRKTLNLDSKMKGILYFMVVEVEFSDGSRYNAGPVLDALEKHLEHFELIYEKKIRPQ